MDRGLSAAAGDGEEEVGLLLIEINDGYALGYYGINSLDYAKLLSARWAELTASEDECDF